MKIILLLAFLVFGIVKVSAQDVTGVWKGTLDIQGNKLSVVFKIAKTDAGYVSRMDSPDQNAFNIETSSTTFENNTLNVKLNSAGIDFTGTLKDSETIEGIFKQGGGSLPLVLKRTNETAKVEPPRPKLRPQEPKPPFPYKSENVKFADNTEKINLAGTLTMPAAGKNFPAVILITGSGPQNRDEEIFGHKPFFVIADFLTRNGIAVLRYDDRGVGESEGKFGAATSRNFADDVEAAIAYLKTRPEINRKKIGLIGHSEGGMIAPMVAAKSKDVAFIVLLAGPGVNGDEVLMSQIKAVSEASKVPTAELEAELQNSRGAYTIVKKDLSQAETEKELNAYYETISAMKSSAADSVKTLTSPWMSYFIRYQPSPILSKVKVPVLALNGEKDLQVLPKINLPAIREALAKGGNKKVTIKELLGLNHLFQQCKTCLIGEYGELEETFSPTALNEMLTWLKEQTK